MAKSTREKILGKAIEVVRRNVSFCKVGLGTFGAVQQIIAQLARLIISVTSPKAHFPIDTTSFAESPRCGSRDVIMPGLNGTILQGHEGRL